MSEPKNLACLFLAPSATRSSLRQSESLFGFVLRAPLEIEGVEVHWGRKLVSPAETSESPEQEVDLADFVLAEVSVSDPAVFYYLGLAKARGKTVVTLSRPKTQDLTLVRRITDYHLEYEINSFGTQDLSMRIRDIIGDIRRADSRELESSSEHEQGTGPHEVTERPSTAPTSDSESPWKDLAFAATHSIGNSLFPIEVYLVHLLDAAVEASLEDSVVAANRALENLEKAKVQVERFKSLSADSPASLATVALLEHLRSSLSFAKTQGLGVDLYHDEDFSIRSDPTQLDEILDELVKNALTWVAGQTQPRITVTLRRAGELELPASLEHGHRGFLWMRFEDNGAGIAKEDKARIFDLFFSRNPQGKGIGLSAIQRSIRQMGGEIMETGTPGHGAVFDLFLPLALPGDESEGTS